MNLDIQTGSGSEIFLNKDPDPTITQGSLSETLGTELLVCIVLQRNGVVTAIHPKPKETLQCLNRVADQDPAGLVGSGPIFK